MASSAEQPRSSPPKKLKTNSYPWYSPRFWHGMRLGDWLALVSRHRFSIHPTRWVMAILITQCAIFNSLAALLQNLLYGAKIRATPIEKPPIFIVGHWRSGTTHLHELMVLDERFAYSTTYQCYTPYHYLVTQWFIVTFFGWLLPKQRPMDNMAAGWNHPQEDEFALCNLGVPSIYTRMAFPNDPPEYMNTLDITELSESELTRWGEALKLFVQTLTYDKKKQIILKSPPHTGRIEVLSKLFPGAKFIHIARNPAAVFPSTVRLWQSLDDVQGLQRPKHIGLHEFVFAAFERMYRGFESQRSKIGSSQLYELRYEDLVRDPHGEVKKIYAALDLGDFEHVRPQLEAYLQTQKDYTTNRHELEPEIKAEIQRRWSGYIERYGYAEA